MDGWMDGKKIKKLLTPPAYPHTWPCPLSLLAQQTGGCFKHLPAGRVMFSFRIQLHFKYITQC